MKDILVTLGAIWLAVFCIEVVLAEDTYRDLARDLNYNQQFNEAVNKKNPDDRALSLWYLESSRQRELDERPSDTPYGDLSRDLNRQQQFRELINKDNYGRNRTGKD
jgi:hypothetical protein